MTINKKVFDKLKGRRVYWFYLDENTGEITDITSSMDYMKVTFCKDCVYNKNDICSWHSGGDYTWCVDDYDYCSCGERKEE